MVVVAVHLRFHGTCAGPSKMCQFPGFAFGDFARGFHGLFQFFKNHRRLAVEQIEHAELRLGHGDARGLHDCAERGADRVGDFGVRRQMQLHTQ